MLDEQPKSAVKPRAAQSFVDRDIGDTSTIAVALRWPRIGRRASAAFRALQHLANHRRSTLGRNHPRPTDPRGIVPNVLIVTAFELCYPITGVVQMKADDPTRDPHCIA
jgi:hypothetical protein